MKATRSRSASDDPARGTRLVAGTRRVPSAVVRADVGTTQPVPDRFREPRRTAHGVCLLLGALALVVAGCSGGLERIPVSGTITLDGKPVEGAAVVFSPVGGGPPASGTTNAQGEFDLKTANQPGAVPGEHYVTVTKQTMHGITPDGMPGPGGIRVEWHVPERYSKSKTSGLKATVSSDQRELTFPLTSK